MLRWIGFDAISIANVKLISIFMYSNDDKTIDELLISVRLGDDDACAELIRLYSPLISELAKGVLSHLPDTVRIDEDELRQEAAIKLYQAALSYRFDENVSFGLYAKICIRNRMISILRKYGSGEITTVEMPSELLDSKECDPSETIISSEREAELYNSIKDVLSPVEFEVFNLYMDGCRSKEISRRLSLDVKSVDNAVYRMKSKIHKLLY